MIKLIKKILLEIYYYYNNHILGYKYIGRRSIFCLGTKVFGKKFIRIGKNSVIGRNSSIIVTENMYGDIYNPILKIGDNVRLGNNTFISCIDEIIIEDDVLTSQRIFISDHIHDYEDIHTPIIYQKLKKRGKVVIKKGAFIGINAVIMPGVVIGENSVVGASSVVIKSVPDYCVVAGNPAKIIKYFNKEEGKRINCNK